MITDSGRVIKTKRKFERGGGGNERKANKVCRFGEILITQRGGRG